LEQCQKHFVHEYFVQVIETLKFLAGFGTDSIYILSGSKPELSMDLAKFVTRTLEALACANDLLIPFFC
jgi:hypothetical protein